MYLIVALIVLVSAIWIGFAFANHFVTPIRRLIGAADEVSRQFRLRDLVRAQRGVLLVAPARRGLAPPR